ncbi:MAG TPA: DUF5343 domain-containing protein [Thermoguttaceae bacterium]|nr:DUF5343 domain-containing protein [Thermoguttaceae bacterium]
MAKKRTTQRPPKKMAASNRAAPKYPYSTSPNALRKFLKEVPQRPRPTRVNNDLLTAWELGGSNANSIIRVLKTIGLVDSSNRPTSDYDSFMQPTIGPALLGEKIKATYAKFFEASHEPYKDDEKLRLLFNIHSGGSDRTLGCQILTFKVLCEFATFDGLPSAATPSLPPTAELTTQAMPASHPAASTPTICIDLHIHLPENKTTRDYQAIIEDIARYIYRHEDFGND